MTTAFNDANGAASDKIPLIITGHQGFIKSNEGQPLRCYPYDVETKYDASYGEVEEGNNHEDRVFEVIRFDGSETASFSKYPDRIDSYELMGKIIAANGEELVTTGERETLGSPLSFGNFLENLEGQGRGGISVTYDSEEKVLRATAPCFATFKVFYFATYQIIYYKPQKTTELGGGGFWGRGFSTYTYGTIVAQLNASYTTFDVPVPTTPDNVRTSTLVEVFTDTVANEAGQWEKPHTGAGWPDPNAGYIGGGETPDPASGYQDNSRMHMIVKINTEGFLSVEEHTVDQADGPTDGTWLSQYGDHKGKKRTSTLAGDPDFSAAIANLNASDVAFIDSKLSQYNNNLEYDTLPE